MALCHSELLISPTSDSGLQAAALSQLNETQPVTSCVHALSLLQASGKNAWLKLPKRFEPWKAKMYSSVVTELAVFCSSLLWQMHLLLCM